MATAKKSRKSQRRQTLSACYIAIILIVRTICLYPPHGAFGCHLELLWVVCVCVCPSWFFFPSNFGSFLARPTLSVPKAGDHVELNNALLSLYPIIWCKNGNSNKANDLVTYRQVSLLILLLSCGALVMIEIWYKGHCHNAASLSGLGNWKCWLPGFHAGVKIKARGPTRPVEMAKRGRHGRDLNWPSMLRSHRKANARRM